jgi:hypothetical protein
MWLGVGTISGLGGGAIRTGNWDSRAGLTRRTTRRRGVVVAWSVAGIDELGCRCSVDILMRVAVSLGFCEGQRDDMSTMNSGRRRAKGRR